MRDNANPVEDKQTQSAPSNQGNENQRKWLVLLALSLPLLMVCISMSALTLALPSIARDLDSSASQLQWINNSYTLVFASAMLTTGALGDRFGRKLILQIGLIIFGIGSLVAALSNSSEMLIALRGFIGAAAAMIMPVTLSIVLDTFRDAKERTQAIGIWAAVVSLGTGIGPLVGGGLLEHFYWGWVLLINLPVVVISLGLDHFFIRESKGQNAPKTDIPGIILSIAGLFVLVYGIIKAGESGWSDPAVLTYLGIGILILAVFVMVESKVTQPMLPPGVFKYKSFTISALTMLLTLFAVGAGLFFFTQYFQSVQGYSPIASAIRELPFAIGMTVSAILAARVAAKFGAKPTIYAGALLGSASYFFLSQVVEVDSSYGTMFIGIALLGIGMGVCSPPATNYLVGSLPVSRAGVASGVNQASRMLGAALGVAVLGSVMNATYRDKIVEVSGFNSLTDSAAESVRSSIQTAHITAGDLPANISATIHDGANEAFVSGMNDAMFVAALVLFGAAILAFVFLPGKIQRRD